MLEANPLVNPASLDAFRLDGKVAVVTGAGSGIGAATTQLFALAGAQVVGADINAENGEDTLGKVAQNGGEGIFEKTDVTDRGAMDALIQKTISTYGKVDILCNVAGTMFPGLLEEVTDEEIDKGINLNLKSAIYGCQAVIAPMKENGSGCIINVSSGAIDAAYEGIGIYAFTKAAVAMFTMTLAKEIGKYGIRVNAIAPGSTLTPFTTWRLHNEDGSLNQEAYDGFLEFARGLSPLGITGEAIDQAYLMLFLASDAGQFCDGNIFRANGGQTMVW